MRCQGLFLMVALLSVMPTSVRGTPNDDEPVGIPPYQLYRPNWGFELSGAYDAFNGHDLVPGQNSTSAANYTRAIGIDFDYQPALLQNIGVLGIGPTVVVYPVNVALGLTSSIFSIYGVGGQIRYQLRLLREQPLVPTIAYRIEYLHYQLTSGQTGAFPIAGPTFGLWFLMNILEPGTAANMFTDSGIARTYLIAELRDLSGSDPTVVASGQSLFFGLRFEF